MRRLSYYDGPIVDSGRTLEEVERDIEKETERCKEMKNWEEE